MVRNGLVAAVRSLATMASPAHNGSTPISLHFCIVGGSGDESSISFTVYGLKTSVMNLQGKLALVVMKVLHHFALLS